MKEKVVRIAGVPDEEAREALTPGTLPVTDGSSLKAEPPSRSQPYTIASKHEKRRSF